MIEDEGAIVLVCTDTLCAILEENDRQTQTVTFHDPLSSAASLTNYTVNIPPSAKICLDWPSLRKAIVQEPGFKVVEKYGGYVIEEDGVILFACDEKLSEEAGRSEGLVDMLYNGTENAPSQRHDRQGYLRLFRLTFRCEDSYVVLLFGSVDLSMYIFTFGR